MSDVVRKRHAEQRRRITEEMTALREILSALVLMDFDQRRRLLRWVCDRIGIDPTKLPLP